MSFAVRTDALTKVFGDHTAVDGIDLRVPEGAIYGFLGSNGAGKSTTIRMILGLRSPSAGSIHLFGDPLRHDRRPLIGAMADSPGGAFYHHLSARDNLRVVALALGVQADLPGLLETVGLAGQGGRKVGGFSTGMRQRLGIARALIGDPRLVILDEPLNGLDPEGVRAMRSLLVDLARGRTMIICSHLLTEVEKVATHIGLLSQGRLVHQGSLAELRAGAAAVVVRSPSPDFGAVAEGMGLQAQPRGDGAWQLSVGEEGTAAEINRRLVEAGVEVSALVPRQFDLEDFYHERVHASR